MTGDIEENRGDSVDSLENATEFSALVSHPAVIDESTDDLSALFISELRKYRDYTLLHLDDNLIAINEIAFWSCATYEVLVPAILHECAKNPIPQSPLVDLVWNNLGGVSDLISGLMGLADTRELTSQKWWKLKRDSVLYLGNGTQMIVLTALASAGLPIGFAVGSGIDLYLSIEPLKHAYNRHVDFSYWLTDSLSHLEKLEQKVDALQAEMQQFSEDIQPHLTETEPLDPDSDQPAQPSSIEKWRDWVMQQKAIRLQKALDEGFALKQDIVYRIHHRQAKTAPSDSEQKILTDCKAHLKSEETRLLDKEPSACNQRLLAFNTNLQHMVEAKPEAMPEVLPRTLQTLAQTPEQHTRIDSEIDKIAKPKHANNHEKRLTAATRVELIRKMSDTSMLLIACVGWTLMCIPGLQIPGAIIVGVAAGLYVIKHAEAIKRNASSAYQYFFPAAAKPLPSPTVKSLTPPVTSAQSFYSNTPLLSNHQQDSDARRLSAERPPAPSIESGVSSLESSAKAPFHRRALSNLYATNFGIVAALGTLALWLSKNTY